ncbi:MAG TPA: pitrilysin family protein [Pyrinomonadaceae bacterium]|nr:pitrilysin family protein [Pyrinomonadaceae bacterium]
MIFKKTLAFVFAVVLFMTTSVPAQMSDKLPPIKYKEITLKNGLRVIMHEDHSTPIVAVNLWYHVGSKNEVAGRTGFAHLFEHMMFQGSKNYDADYFTPLQEAGANLNGSTNPDRTNYWEVVPSNFLETALFLEADRMGGLLEAMTMDKLNNQRDVVKNERRQNYENQPYGTAGEKAVALMYPKEHPYSWTTIGSLDDLTAASMDDVKSFFRQYYVPNNASLVIAGDFDPKEAQKLVEKHFGGIAKGAPITRPNVPMPKLDKEIRVSYEDNVQLARLYMSWHTVPNFSKDAAALSILGGILSAGRGSRLQSNLVYDKQIAQTVSAFNGSQEIAGRFQIVATARPNKTLDEIEKELNTEIERIKKEPPTQDEIARSVNQIESSFIFNLQSVGGFGGKSDQLNQYATFVGKPDYFQADLDRFRAVTPADISRVANTYLTDKRLVMSFVPRPKGKEMPKMNATANQQASVSKKEKVKIDDSKLPKPTANPKFALPNIEKTKLSNGLEVWLVKQSELPIITMNMVFKTGTTADPQGLTGVGDTTSSLLDDGTKTRSAVEIANEVQSIGAQLSTGSGDDSSSVGISTLTKNFDKALDIYADVIQNAEFPEAEVETSRRRALVGLLQRRDNANAISGLVYNRILYGDAHPYGVYTNEASVKAIKRNDLKKFYSAYYRPNNAVLIIVGDTNLKTLTPKLEAKFKDWQAGEISAMTLPTAPVRDKAMIYVVDKPGAAQSVISIGQIGVARDNPDYFPLQVMNTLLGGAFTSRINMNLREDKGYTYGARSGFSYRRGAGPFTASAGVQTAVTKESVVEFLKEIRGVRGEIPVTQQELEYNKQSLIRSYPRNFETVEQIAGQLANVVTYGLPDTYFNDYISRVNAVTLEDVNRVANKYLSPDKLAIVVVGDRKTIEPGLKQIEGLGNSIIYLDAEGNPIKQ